MNCEVPLPAVLPRIFLVDLYADQVGEHTGQAAVVITFYPHDFDPALGIRKLANVRQEAPVIFLKAREIEIAEDVAQQNELLETEPLQRTQRIGGAAGLRAEVQIGNDERMAKPIFHCLIYSASMLSSDEGEVKLWTQNLACKPLKIIKILIEP